MNAILVYLIITVSVQVALYKGPMTVSVTEVPSMDVCLELKETVKEQMNITKKYNSYVITCKEIKIKDY